MQMERAACSGRAACAIGYVQWPQRFRAHAYDGPVPVPCIWRAWWPWPACTKQLLQNSGRNSRDPIVPGCGTRARTLQAPSRRRACTGTALWTRAYALAQDTHAHARARVHVARVRASLHPPLPPVARATRARRARMCMRAVLRRAQEGQRRAPAPALSAADGAQHRRDGRPRAAADPDRTAGRRRAGAGGGRGHER